MSNKTRYFVLTAVAILGVGLTTGLVASYMGLPVAFSRAAGPDELQYVPANAAVVAYADVREVMASHFRERFRKFEPDTKERDQFQQKTGVNIEQDIHTVVAALMPGAEGQSDWRPESGVLILARGRFDRTRLEALAVEHGGTAEDYNGKRLLTHKDGDTDHPEMAVGFIDADLIALGGYASVKAAIDAGSGNNVLSNTELMRQVNDLDASNAWAVGRFDAIARAGHLPSEIQSHVPAIQWFSAATHINGGVSGVLKAETRDEEAAKNVRDIVQGFLAMAKMHASSKPELQAVVDSLQLSGEGKNIALSFQLPSEFFDALEAMSGHRRSGPDEKR
jgi:hypothetical protein